MSIEIVSRGLIFAGLYFRDFFFHKLPSPPLASEHALISCPLCKKAGRGDFPHYLSECTYLPDTGRKFIAKARQIVGILDCD